MQAVRLHFILPISIYAALLFSGCQGSTSIEDVFQNELGSSDVVWASVNVSQQPSQGDAHVIVARGGPTFLIDGGQVGLGRQFLLPFLRRHGITHIDKVFITHPHYDHYGGVIDLLEERFSIGEIYWDEPTQALCESEPWGCKYNDIERLKNYAKINNVQMRPLEDFHSFSIGTGTFENIFPASGAKCPIAICTVNDRSLIARLQIFGLKVLFTGDMDAGVGAWLTQNHAPLLQADFLKVPHHGASGLPDQAFFEAVQPRFAIVPTFRELWCSPRSAQARDWLNTKGVETYTNSDDTVFVHFYENGQTSIETVNPRSASCP